MPPTSQAQAKKAQSEPTNQPSGNNNPKDGGSTSQAPVYNLEQEREAILRMIAEGRVTPEEGDLLLEALGS